tara:strand:+ start:87 stop:404 length:318 start_codon:yes stop_codon:yes gene_type:complete
MKKPKIYYFLEYLSATYILSYFFIHNIFLVIIGIIFSLYLINISFINGLIRSFPKDLVTFKAKKSLNKINKESKIDSINMKSIKDDSALTLVETIEELGYIPSID